MGGGRMGGLAVTTALMGGLLCFVAGFYKGMLFGFQDGVDFATGEAGKRYLEQLDKRD
jgi:hypothetical protein